MRSTCYHTIPAAKRLQEVMSISARN